MFKDAHIGRGRAASQRRLIIDRLEPRLHLAGDIYVDANSPGPTHDGSSWQNAYADLQTALGAAVSGNRILVADGVYKPTTTTDRTISFQIENGVTLLGGYAGYGAPDPDDRNPAARATTLSGDIGVPGSRADNSYHVLVADAPGGSATVDGFVISWGSASGNAGTYDKGAGIYIADTSLTVSSCKFTGNTSSYGGAVYSTGSATPTLVSSIFAGNSALAGGGGFYNTGTSAASLYNCVFVGNSGYNGGGILLNGGSLKLINSTLVNNSADSAYGFGGGIDCEAHPTVTNSILWGNTAKYSSQMYGFATATYSDIQGGYSGTRNINADPLFIRPASPGPDGYWRTADDDYGDLRLQLNSPAIDAGNNGASGLSGITADLAGQNRFADVPQIPDTGSGTAPIVDLGAYEADAPPSVLWGVVNRGVQQRSMVNQVAVVFSEVVLITPSALTVVRADGSPIPDLKVTPQSSDQRTWELTFTVQGIVGASLPDGLYCLKVTGGAVMDLGANHLPSDYIYRFHRLFGDFDGDRDVDSGDLAQFRYALNRPSHYQSRWYFDFDGNGSITLDDCVELKRRMSRRIL